MPSEHGLSPARWRELVSRVDDLLLSEWDPIGVNTFEGAFDEYSSYAPGLTRVAMRGNAGAVADQLSRLRTQSMGLRSNMTADRVFAERLVAVVAEALTAR